MKSLVRSSALVAFAALIIWAMGHYNLIDFALIASAFANAKLFVMATAIVQTAVFLILLARFVLIVRAFGVGLKTTQLAAATFVSVAVGQWAPGSIAFMEAIRMGIMLGTDTSAEKMSDVKARLVAASFYDRLLGFVVILYMGLAFSASLFVWQFMQTGWSTTVASLAALSAFSFLGGTCLLALPFFSRLGISKRLLIAAHAALEKPAHKKWFSTLALLGQKLLVALESLRHVLASGGTDIKRFVPAMMVSAVAAILTNVVTFLAAYSLGTPISFLAIASVFPVISVASLIPMGFAGIGGYQLVSVAVLGIFGVEPHIAAGASLMQTAMSLLISTLLGLVFVKTGMQQKSRRISAPNSSKHCDKS